MRLNCFVPLLLAWMMALAPAATADNLTMTPTLLATTLAPGATWNVTGTITNLSGADLFSTDLFLTFSGYPDATLAPAQTLGGEDILIADRHSTGAIALFSLSLLPGAVDGASYSFDVFAVSISGDFSNVSTFRVTVGVVPEPSHIALMVAGLLALALRQACGTGLAGSAVSHNA